ncbi:hypothetical protein K1T71_007120 [Dendrolimus kikuchii]|uniref:Uncharacterized protein n=1 Tax=Dendrolimus kikuchii TaxID=765133 RepID=A0ACC1CZV2_9NEOP|nr:hypothetical protein K1T71_007120 [Dendrolimus kikuchii]
MLQWILVILFTVCSCYQSFTVTSCLWHNNSCVEICPEWMVEKKNSCFQSYWNAQRTCEHPEVMLVGTVCGFSRCDCPDGLVLDSETGYCYDVDNCPTKHKE